MEPDDQVGTTTPFFESRLILLRNIWTASLTGPLSLQWFGDLKDGVRTGEPGDPRIGIIQVIPTEVRPLSSRPGGSDKIRSWH